MPYISDEELNNLKVPSPEPPKVSGPSAFYAQGSMPAPVATPVRSTTPTEQAASQQPAPIKYTPTQETQGAGTTTPKQADATPTEQRAAGNTQNILPYEDIQSWFNPFSASGFGTPTELRSGGGYGPSSVQWSEDANNLALMQKGISPAAMAENAVNTTYSFLTDFGVRPEFITPYVQSRLGLNPEDMIAMGYAQDPYGRWILLDFGDAPEGSSGGSSSGGGGSAGGRGGGGRRGATGGSSFRSGYTSGLINWRIGI